MRHPFDYLTDEARSKWLKFMIFATLVVFAGVYPIDFQTNTDAAPLGQFSLQLAGTTEAATSIVDSWRAAGVLHLAGASVGLDFMFTAAYAVMLAIAGSWVASRALGSSRPGWVIWGALAAYAGLVAGLLDVFEGVLLLDIIGDPSSGSPQLVRGVALAKVALIGVAVLTWLLGGLMTRDTD